jgi:hypothetical protein
MGAESEGGDSETRVVTPLSVVDLPESYKDALADATGTFRAGFQPFRCAWKLSGRFSNQQHLRQGDYRNTVTTKRDESHETPPFVPFASLRVIRVSNAPPPPQSLPHPLLFGTRPLDPQCFQTLQHRLHALPGTARTGRPAQVLPIECREVRHHRLYVLPIVLALLQAALPSF